MCVNVPRILFTIIKNMNKCSKLNYRVFEIPQDSATSLEARENRIKIDHLGGAGQYLYICLLLAKYCYQ